MSSPPPLIAINDVRAAYGDSEVLRGITLSVPRNSRWAVIGPNGAGKSTLVKILAGLLPAFEGAASIDGCDIRRFPARKRARKIGYVPQKPEGVVPYTVRDFIMLGRYCSMGFLGLPTESDRRKVAEAAAVCDVEHLLTRLMGTLSGGELQRVLLAGAVAQDAPVLLLDEPTTFLDPAHEHLFFEALSRLHGIRELTTIMITHDINAAILQCTHIAALRSGALVFSGTAAEFRSRCPGILNDIFGVSFQPYSSIDGRTAMYGSWGASCQM
jgi:iron complex transport system ATP-binding protein